jgi:hypothetical protein
MLMMIELINFKKLTEHNFENSHFEGEGVLSNRREAVVHSGEIGLVLLHVGEER